MRQFSDDLYDRMQDKLREVSADQTRSPLRRAKDNVAIVMSAIVELKEFILSYKFSDQKEEISFFKEVQPEFYSLLIYYIRIVTIESRIPVGTKQQRCDFLEKELKQMDAFFEQNTDIYKYYRMEDTSMDTIYFTRNNKSEQLPTEDAYLLYDSRFCTEMGYKVARIKANELLRPYLEERIDEQEPGHKSMPRPLTWRLKKVHLAELIFLLHAYGAFGNLKIKAIVEVISVMWNCPISNIYKIIEEMRIRKKERFPFTKRMLTAAEQKMDEEDLRAR